MVATAAVAFGMVTFFARSLTDAGLAPPAVIFFRYLLGALVLSPFFRRAWRDPRIVGWGLAGGVAVSFGWITYVRAIEIAPVATAGVVYMTYPLFTMLMAWIMFRQRPHVRSIVAAVLIVSAAAVALRPDGLSTATTRALLLSFGAPLAFGFSIAVLTERLVRLAPVERNACFMTGAVVALSPVVFALPRNEVIPTHASTWLLVLGISLVSALIPQLVYSFSAPFLGPARTATAGSLELPTIFISGALLLGEPLTFAQVGAGMLVIVAVLLTPVRPPSAISADPISELLIERTGKR